MTYNVSMGTLNPTHSPLGAVNGGMWLLSCRGIGYCWPRIENGCQWPMHPSQRTCTKTISYSVSIRMCCSLLMNAFARQLHLCGRYNSDLMVIRQLIKGHWDHSNVTR